LLARALCSHHTIPHKVILVVAQQYSHMQPADWCVMVSASHVAAARLDVSMRLSPEGLVGRFLRVYWEANDAWFAGSVVEYDQNRAQHKVGHSTAPSHLQDTHCTVCFLWHAHADAATAPGHIRVQVVGHASAILGMPGMASDSLSLCCAAGIVG
jgi:hypothetical protein